MGYSFGCTCPLHQTRLVSAYHGRVKVNQATSRMTADEGSAANVCAMFEAFLELTLAAGLRAISAKGLPTTWRSNSKRKVAQHRRPSGYLSEIEELLCCVLVVQSMNTAFDHWTASIPGLISGVANVYSTVRSKLQSLTANNTAESSSPQTVNSDLLAAVVKHTTSRLRSSITSCPIAAHCCLEMLVLTAALDSRSPEAVISQFVKQGEHKFAVVIGL